MAGITDLLMQTLGQGGLSEISNKVGADPNTTSTALSAAVPLLVSALARNASQPQGAQALHQAIASDHNGQLLDNTQGYLQNPQAANGSGILGHVLGSQQGQVEQALSSATGLNAGQVGQVLAIAAPLVMAYLGRQQHQQNMSPDQLSQFLGQQKQQEQAQAPDAMGMLEQLLGGQGGSSAQSIGGMLGKLLGGQ